MKKLKINLNESGQALLLVLLAMAAIVTVILSVASRSVTDISVTSSEEDALRAFSAAEAGIEKALLTNTGSGPTPVSVNPSDSSVTYTSNIIATGGESAFEHPNLLKSGETATFWMVSHDTNGDLTCVPGNDCYPATGQPIRVCWGDGPAEAPDANKPAVRVTVYYDTSSPVKSLQSPPDYSQVKVGRLGFDHNSGRRAINNFTDISGSVNNGSCKIGTKQLLYRSDTVSINPATGNRWCNQNGCILAIKVGMHYNTTPQSVAVSIPGGVIPPQGSRIESTGVAGTSTRKVNVFQTFADPPSVFDSALFSQGDITK